MATFPMAGLVAGHEKTASPTYMEGHRNCLAKIGTEPEPVSGVDKMFSPSRTRSKWKPKGGVNHEEIQQANAQVFGPPAAGYQV
jgi:hypothetical protein